MKFVAGLLTGLMLPSCSGRAQDKPNGDLEITGHSGYHLPVRLSATDTSAGWKLAGPKLLLTGQVLQADGKTPAPDVVIYYYQTNTEGRYLHKPDEPRTMPPNKIGQTHGYIRGRVKTDRNGRYWIYTVRPGTYPSRSEPAHVHATVKEPNAVKEYYIDDFVFDDDVLLTSSKRRKMENRGGSGVLRMVRKDRLLIGERNIILGLNIPDYPKRKTTQPNSGRNIGEDVLSFTPFHAWGPDKGTTTCPVCKYGWYNGVLLFVGNNPDWQDIRLWLTFLESESRKRQKYLKVYFIYGNDTGYSKSAREKQLQQLGMELGITKTALTYVPAFSDIGSDIVLNKINPAVANTLIVYRRGIITGKYINIKAGKESFESISELLDKSDNVYFGIAD